MLGSGVLGVLGFYGFRGRVSGLRVLGPRILGFNLRGVNGMSLSRRDLKLCCLKPFQAVRSLVGPSITLK